MNGQEFYYTIESNGSAEVKNRGSRFIAYAFPLKNARELKERMNEIKKMHPKATHHCFAYRIGLDGNNFRVSDDGEPSGTAGKPILGQIDSKKLSDVLIIVVRYFGGTLLGVPGLISAYRSAAALVLQTVPIARKNVESAFLIQFDYTMMNMIMNIIKQHHCRIIQQDIQLFCRMSIAVAKRVQDEVIRRINDLPNVGISKID